MRSPVASLLVAGLACGFAGAQPALAQQAGDNVVQIGWARAAPLRSRTSAHTDVQTTLGGTLLGIPDSFDMPDVSAQARTLNILVFSTTHFWSAHFSTELVTGIPPKVEIEGRGIAAPPGPSGALFRVDIGDPAFQPLGSSRQWSPALFLQYHFFEAADRLRPYAGIGVTYTWFTHTHLNPAFEQAINSNFGAPLALAAGKSGPTSTSASIAPLWEPEFKLGVSWALTQRWSLSSSAVYVPYSTITTTQIKSMDGTTLATNRARIKVDALAGAVLLGYRL